MSLVQVNQHLSGECGLMKLVADSRELEGGENELAELERVQAAVGCSGWNSHFI